MGEKEIVMANTPLRKSPLQMPTNSAEFLRTFVYDRAPTTADFKNFKISDLWIHRNPSGTPPYGYYVLVDKPSQTGVWLDLGGTQEGDIQCISGDGGTPVNPDASGNVNILGGLGVTTTGTGDTLTINASLPSLTWTVDTTTPINVNVTEAHIANAGGAITFNLPAAAGVGDGFAFFDLGGNGFIIQNQAGQTIRLGNQVTSSGGTITSTAIGDVIWMVCAVANTTFLVYSAQGNLTLA